MPKTPEIENDQQLTLSLSDLKSLLASQGGKASDSALATALEKLAESMLESRKPYVDPKQIENQETMRQQMRENEIRKAQNVAFEQEACPHTQGSNPLSERSNGDSAFARLRLDTGEEVGVCTVCQKVISTLKPEDTQFFSKKGGGNKTASAGVRQFGDPLKVMVARLAPDERATILGTRS